MVPELVLGFPVSVPSPLSLNVTVPTVMATDPGDIGTLLNAPVNEVHGVVTVPTDSELTPETILPKYWYPLRRTTRPRNI